MAGTVRFDRYEVDLQAHRISRRGRTLRLRDQPLTVLIALLEHPGEVVTRDDLRRRLWPNQVFVDFDNVLNTAVARLRGALHDSADHPRFIETLPKHGYRFMAPVEHSGQAAQDPNARRMRLLVLPFMNTAGPAEEYFADAMTDEIITALALLAPNEVAVIARTTAFHYKKTNKDIAAIARELRVDYVVEGGARRAGENVALNVQLVRVTDQAHVWAARYDARLDDVFGIEKTMADTIGAALGVTSRGENHSARQKPTADLEAYTLYRQGRHHLITQTPENFEAAKRYFEQAVARDPQFALAYDALADLWWYYDFMGFAPPKAVAGIGMSYALRALEIDNTLAETHALLGHFRWLFDYDWAAVKRHLDRARELDPTSPLVRVRYAMGPLLTECRLAEAIAEMEAAVESDPLSIFMRLWLAIMLYLDRQYDQAIEQGRLMVEIEPANYVGYWIVGAYTREKGLFGESIAAHRKAVELSGGAMLMLGWLGLALGQAGKRDEARRVLQQLHAAADRQAYVQPSCFAWTYLGLGDIDNAFLWMDRAVDGCDRMMVPIQLYPFLDPVRGDSRYAELLRKMRLEPVIRAR